MTMTFAAQIVTRDANYPGPLLSPHSIAGWQKLTTHRNSDLFSWYQAKMNIALKTKNAHRWVLFGSKSPKNLTKPA